MVKKVFNDSISVVGGCVLGVAILSVLFPRLWDWMFSSTILALFVSGLIISGIVYWVERQ